MTTKPTNPIETIRRADGTRGVYYFGHKVGDYAPIAYRADDSRRWRAVSVHGLVAYACNENAARAALLGMYQ